MLNKGEGMCVFIIYGLRQTQVVVAGGGDRGLVADKRMSVK